MALTPTTWNPADKDATVTLSGGDLTAVSTTGGVRSVFGATSARFYWEVSLPSTGAQMIGIGTESYSLSAFPGADSESVGYLASSGSLYLGGVVVATAAGFTSASIVSVLLDTIAQNVTFWVDGDDADGVLTASIAGMTGSLLHAAFGNSDEVTANFGGSAFTYTPPSGYVAGLGYDPDQLIEVGGVSLFSAGAPEVIRGPNQVVIASGVAVTTVGTPSLQLGHPVTLLPGGVSVFSAGAPAVLPYSNRAVQVAGKSLLQAGYPTIQYNPIVGGTDFIAPAGVSVLSTGTPTMAAAASVQASGVSVFSAGSPSLRTGIGVSGSSLLSAGTPTIGVGVGAAGVSLFQAGTPQLNTTIHAQGHALLRAGLPQMIAGEYIVQPTGAAVFSAGTPRISNMTIHPWGKSHLRTGTPKAIRGAKC